MKKHSKAVERHPAETIGIDLGDKMSRYLILNQEGLEVEEGSFRNHADSIARPRKGRPPVFRYSGLDGGSTRILVCNQLSVQRAGEVDQHRAEFRYTDRPDKPK